MKIIRQLFLIGQPLQANKYKSVLLFLFFGAISIRILFSIVFLAVGYAAAQSLKPESPYPLQAGINKGTADSLVGTQYWYFYASPGNSRVTVRLRAPTTLYGTELRNNRLTITLYDEKRTWRNAKSVTSRPNETEATFTADKVAKKMKIIVSVAPPNQNLVRMGGEYEIEVNGDVQFDAAKSAGDPIVRAYQPKTGIDGEDYGTVRFNADGTIETANGYTGTWKLFDRENRIYTVVVGRLRVSVQYLPGYGLVQPDDPKLIVFQELRR
ncbi:MAG: hypothetical protein ACRD6X_02640 [Pyrinomonadaceae bacterium]